MNGLIENYGLDPQSLTCLATYFDVKAQNRDFEDSTLDKALEASSWVWGHFDAIDKSCQHTACQLITSLIDTRLDPAIKKEVRERLIERICHSSLISLAIGKVSLFLTPARILSIVSEENARQCELIVKMGIIFKEKLPQDRQRELDHLDQLIAVALGQEGAMQEQAQRIRQVLHPSSVISILPPACGAEAAVVALPRKKNKLFGWAENIAKCTGCASPVKSLDEADFALLSLDDAPACDPNIHEKLKLLTEMLEKALLKHAPTLFSNYSGPIKERFLASLKAVLPRLSAFLFTTDPRNLVQKEKLLIERALSTTHDFLTLFIECRSQNIHASIEAIVDQMLVRNRIDPNAFADERWSCIEQLVSSQLESNTDYLPRPDGLKEFMQTVAPMAAFLFFEEYVSPVWVQKALGRALKGPINLNPFANTRMAASPPVALFDASDEQFSKRVGDVIHKVITLLVTACSTSSVKASVISGASSFFKTEIGKAIQQSLNKVLNSEVSMTPFLAFYHLIMTEEDREVTMEQRQEQIFQLIKSAMQNDSIAKKIPSGWESIVKNTITLFLSILENEKALKFFAYYLLKAVAVK